MKIDRIIIPCNIRDFELAKICIASVRYWYPKIPIYLLPDYNRGFFDTRETQIFNVEILESAQKNFGGAFGHWEPFFHKEKFRALIIDADIVLLGNVLEKLEQYDEDIIVGAYNLEDPNDSFVDTNYYNYKKLKEFDPEFQYPGYVFNAGQFVTNSGLFKRSDFSNLVEYQNNKTVKKHPDIFRLTDQGIFNYFIAKQAQLGKISVGKCDFYYWRKNKNLKHVNLKSIKEKKGYPFLLHWSGYKLPSIKYLEKSEILLFYQNYYYRHIKFGLIKKSIINLKSSFKTKKRILNQSFIKTIFFKNLPGRIKVKFLTKS